MLSFEIDDPSQIIGADIAGTIIRGLYKGTETLRNTVLGIVIDKTPFLSGGLQADETGTFNTDPSDTELIHVYTENENQLNNWSRVYVMYVEGPALGISTWTNPPRKMFDSTVEDTKVFEEWGIKGLQVGVGDVVAGRSLRL